MNTKRSTITATEARVHFGEVLRRVDNNEAITIVRDGEPKAVIISVEEYQKLCQGTPNQVTLNDRILKARERYLREAKDTHYDIESEIRQMREDRSTELDNSLH